MALSRVYDNLSSLIIRKLGDVGGPPQARVGEELDNIISHIDTELHLGMFTNTSSGTSIANTTTETSYFTGVSSGSGATRTIAASSSKAGTLYRIRVEGDFLTTGTPTAQFRVKFGSTVVADSTAFTSPNNNSGQFILDVYLHIFAIGASGTVRGHMRGSIANAFSGVVTTVIFQGANETGSIDLTAAQTIDVTLQWGTAAAGNTSRLTGVAIERIR